MKFKYYLVPFLFYSTTVIAQTSCDVSNLYQAETVPGGIKVLTTDDEIGDLDEVVQLILKETTLDAGTYEIELTRKGSNLYKVDGTNLYIETRYCYEYGYGEDAILRMTSNYGFTKGQVIWP